MDLRRRFVLLLLLLALAALPSSPRGLLGFQGIAEPYLFSLLTWEATSLPDKWLHKVRETIPWGKPSEEARKERVREFFRLSSEIRELEEGISRARSGLAPASEVSTMERKLEELKGKRQSLQGEVEETLEGQLSLVLAEESLARRWGVLFPPVDFSFSPLPKILVISPRQRIELDETILLRPGMGLREMEALEKAVEARGVSALVEGLGGIATYPSIVHSGSLQDSLVTAAHEWLHQYFFFHPLGRSYLSGPEMTTLNETAADLAGRELGELVYYRFYEKRPPPPQEPPQPPPPPEFDFTREMRNIRIAVEAYLARGEIERAEAFMEEKQQFLATKGYYLRRLNQAYFAFHGSYAESPASVSPIGDQLKELRRKSPTLGAFIKKVAGFSSYEMLLQELAGTSPAP